MPTVLKIEKDGGGTSHPDCWKCRRLEVEDNSLDLVYRLKCNLCYKYRKEKWKLQWMRVKKDKMINCKFCWDAFRRTKNLEAHKCPIGIYQCTQCAYQQNSNKSLEIHMKKVHDTTVSNLKQRQFHCKTCDKLFSTSEKLNIHLRTHTGEKPYACKICKKAFNVSWTLTNHLRTHSGAKPYTCKVCKKGFAVSGSLKNHLRIHTGEKPYMCKVCKNAFTESGSLIKHLRTHSGEQPYACQLCKKKFTQSGSLKKHLRRTHTG